MSSFRYPVEEIRDKCDLVEIISAHVALKKSGRNLLGLCPFHNEKTPSFYVNPERGIWKCFGCGESGDVFSFVQKIENLTFPEAVEQLARKTGVKIEYSEKAQAEYSERERILRANNIACEFFRSMLAKSDKAQQYLAKRGLETATVEKYRLGYAPDAWDGLLNHFRRERVKAEDAAKAGLVIARERSSGFYDRFRDRLIFPILDTSERIVGFGGRAMGDAEPKYLNTPETVLFRKNKTLYGLNIAKRAVGAEDRFLIVEGYMDAISAQEAGFENTVATMGTALTADHIRVLSRFTKNVVLAFDADSAGMNAALRSGTAFEREGFSVRIMSMPKGEDPDSILRGGDASRFAGLIEKAIPIPDYQVRRALVKYDLHSEDGRTEALKETIGVLAGVESAVDRERLLKKLARFHPSFSSGTTVAEEDLRAELKRARTRAVKQDYRPKTADAQKNASSARSGRQLSLVERSERLLMGIIIVLGADHRKVFQALPAKEFTDEAARILALAVEEQDPPPEQLDVDRLRADVQETPAAELLTDLLIGTNDSELNHPVEGLVSAIINHKKNERLRRMRDLARKFSEGAIKSGDEEFEEYHRLVREIRR